MPPTSPDDRSAPASCHAIFGLVVRSELPLIGLRPLAKQAVADVDIRIAPLAAPVTANRIFTENAALVLEVPDVARFRVGGGREIVVEPVPGADAADIRLYLLGSVFGALLHGRGILPLHANAVEMGGAAVAFCGHPGAGKSTLAAWFADRGRRILADDVCVVGEEGGTVVAHAGFPRLRLWADALERSGRDAADYPRSFAGLDKFDVPTEASDGPDRLPLGAVYRLGRAAGTTGGIRRLAGAEAVEVLVGNTYRGGYLSRLGETARHWAQCVDLARRVPVFAADRVWGFDDFDAEGEKLGAHALDVIAAAGP